MDSKTTQKVDKNRQKSNAIFIGASIKYSFVYLLFLKYVVLRGVASTAQGVGNSPPPQLLFPL